MLDFPGNLVVVLVAEPERVGGGVHRSAVDDKALSAGFEDAVALSNRLFDRVEVDHCEIEDDYVLRVAFDRELVSSFLEVGFAGSLFDRNAKQFFGGFYGSYFRSPGSQKARKASLSTADISDILSSYVAEDLPH